MSNDEKSFVITLGECPFCGGSVEAEIGVTVRGDSLFDWLNCYYRYAKHPHCPNHCPIGMLNTTDPVRRYPDRLTEGTAQALYAAEWKRDCDLVRAPRICPRCGNTVEFKENGAGWVMLGCPDCDEWVRHGDTLADLAREWDEKAKGIEARLRKDAKGRELAAMLDRSHS